MARGVAGTPENLMASHPFEKMHPCAARAACGPQKGDNALVARYELATAHEAEVPLESRTHVAESVECERGASRTGDSFFDYDFHTHSRASYPARGFKDLRLFAVRSSLSSLEEKPIFELPYDKYGQEIHDDHFLLHLRQD